RNECRAGSPGCGEWDYRILRTVRRCADTHCALPENFPAFRRCRRNPISMIRPLQWLREARESALCAIAPHDLSAAGPRWPADESPRGTEIHRHRYFPLRDGSFGSAERFDSGFALAHERCEG